jgi:hypothetical protein
MRIAPKVPAIMTTIKSPETKEMEAIFHAILDNKIFVHMITTTSKGGA